MLIDCAVNAHSTTRQYDDVKVSIKSINNKNYFLFGISVFTGKSFSEVLILASTNPQCDKRLFIDLPAQAQNMLCTKVVFCFDIQNNSCTQHVLRL